MGGLQIIVFIYCYPKLIICFGRTTTIDKCRGISEKKVKTKKIIHLKRNNVIS